MCVCVCVMCVRVKGGGERERRSKLEKWKRIDSGNIAEFGQKWLLEAHRAAGFPLNLP